MTCTTITAYREQQSAFKDAADKAKAANQYGRAIHFTGEVRALQNMIMHHQCGPKCMEAQEKHPQGKKHAKRV